MDDLDQSRTVLLTTIIESEVNTGLTSLRVWTLAIDPDMTATLYAGTLGGAVFGMQQVVYRRYLPLIVRAQ